MAFAYIRRMFGVNEYDFLSSVCENANYIEFISNAKSGQFFFYSSDGKYMIKTMTNDESKFLRRSEFLANIFFLSNLYRFYDLIVSSVAFIFLVLPHYFRHCSQNPNTLITKFFGMYRVKMYHLRRNVKFIIMNSVFDTDKTLQSFYDLKGSTTGRDAKPGEDVKKDNDVRKGLPENAFALPPRVRDRLREQITRDCDFFKHMKIMDYSMLLAVHHIPPRNGGGSTVSGSSSRKNSVIKHEKNAKVGGSVTSETDGNFPRGSPGTPKTDQKSYELQSEESVKSLNAEYSILMDDDDDDFSLLDDYNKLGNKSGELDAKKREATEQLFWPFHRLYDIQGRRLLTPNQDGDSPNDDSKICQFVTPISNRVDKGLVMDSRGVNFPLEYRQGGNKVGLCEGKIFYMGIIDVLQQFNLRKRIEAKWRRRTGSGWADASCVHPNLYADRFVKFFDEYSTRNAGLEEGENEDEDEEEDLQNVEEVIFQKEEKREKLFFEDDDSED